MQKNMEVRGVNSQGPDPRWGVGHTVRVYVC